MKLLLCSSDFENEKLKVALSDLVGKPLKETNIAVINEASAVETGDKRWIIDGLKLMDETCGEIDFVNLLALSLEEVTERLNTADIIFCFGGSTEYLKVVFDKTGFSEVLPKFLDKKVWVGSSAGSCVLGRRLSKEASKKIYGKDYGYVEDNYLSIVDFAILPHYKSEFVPEKSYNVLVEESKIKNYPIYAISDSSAILVKDNIVTLIGDNGVKLLNGEVVEKC